MGLGKQKYNPISGKFDIRVTEKEIKEISGQIINTLSTDNPSLAPGEYIFDQNVAAALNIDFDSTASVGAKWIFRDPHWTYENFQHLLGQDGYTFLNRQGGVYEAGKFELNFKGAEIVIVKDSDTQFTVDTGFIPDPNQIEITNIETATAGQILTANGDGTFTFM